MSLLDNSARCAIEAAEMFDDAVITANAIEEFGIVKEPEELHPSLLIQVSRLHERAIALKGLSVVYSGEGFIPMEDCCGETVTVYTDTECAKGKINDIYLTDEENLQYVRSDDVDFDDEEAAIFHPQDLEGHDIEVFRFRQMLKEAPSGLRLFVEFVVQNEVDIDHPIRGHAIRVPELTTYNIMDAASLEIVFIDGHDDDPLVDSFEVNPALWRFTNHYRKQIQHKRFRNLSAEKQQSQIEAFLENANRALQLDRFSVAFDGAHVFVPNAGAESGFELGYTERGFIGSAIRLDCIESSILSAGNPIRKRKGNYNSYVSTCVVTEIDDETRDMLELESNIVWLPVMNQHHQMHFLEKDLV